MKYLILLSTLLTAISCGKKISDPGAQFNILSSTDFKASGADGGFVINRDDENSGPSFKMEGNMAAIEFFDKTITCGPVTLNARRALKNDISFSNFKISEAEFHGLNQLPVKSSCQLSVTGTNGAGSTVTKTSKVEMLFNKFPAIKIDRQFAVTGLYQVKSTSEVPLDYYEISNPLPYSIPFKFRPTRSIFVKPGYSASQTFNPFFGKGTSISHNRVQFYPANLTVTGTSDIGFQFKVGPNQLVRVWSFGEIPLQIKMDATKRQECSANSLTALTTLAVTKVSESSPSLTEELGFELDGETDANLDLHLNSQINFSEFQPTSGYDPAVCVN